MPHTCSWKLFDEKDFSVGNLHIFFVLFPELSDKLIVLVRTSFAVAIYVAMGKILGKISYWKELFLYCFWTLTQKYSDNEQRVFDSLQKLLWRMVKNFFYV